MSSEHEYLQALQVILANFQGREYSDPIDRHTLFFEHLGMTSIDAVVLGETLQTQFAREYPFAEFLAELGARNAQDLSVGELVDFLMKHD